MGAAVCLGKNPGGNTNTKTTSRKSKKKNEGGGGANKPKSDQRNSTASNANKNNPVAPVKKNPEASKRKIEGAEIGDIADKYDIAEIIGRGGFSTVYEAIRRSDGAKFAVKIVEKTMLQEDIKLLKREIDIMKHVDHVNILKLMEIFEDDDKVYIVMELVEGSELFDRIVDKGYYSEKSTVHIIKQILYAVRYLHQQGIAHRDLKPENLLCSGEGANETVKIADFGLSKIFAGEKGEELQTSCGTPGYVAPEVLMSEHYDKSVDMWGIGIITYILLAGYPPFYADNDTQLFEKIMNADYDFDDECWDDVSEGAKDFIKHLLVKNPEERFSADQALEHTWITSTAPDKSLNIHQRMSQYNLARKEQAKRTDGDSESADSD